MVNSVGYGNDLLAVVFVIAFAFWVVVIGLLFAVVIAVCGSSCCGLFCRFAGSYLWCCLLLCFGLLVVPLLICLCLRFGFGFRCFGLGFCC